MNKSADIPTTLPLGYLDLVGELKRRIGAAQARVSVWVNREILILYWEIGHSILRRQERYGWGAKVVDQLAQDLAAEFPTLKGFSPRNLKYMRRFAEAWPDRQIVQQAAAQLPWGHNLRILEGVPSPSHRLFYIQEALRNGWTRAELDRQIQTRLHERQGKAPNTFDAALPEAQSKLAQEVLKDPYFFTFFAAPPKPEERDIEQGLIDHLQKFLLELGVGFAFVGRQAPIRVHGDEFFLDLLFYHTRLRCYVVVELKRGKFSPESVGKLQFYLAAVDAQMRHPEDRPSIGIILCQSKNRTVVEYALRDAAQPIGVSEYRILETLPTELTLDLPSSQQLKTELGTGCKKYGVPQGTPCPLTGSRCSNKPDRSP